MQIETKKDIESAYKDEIFKGFSLKETIAIVSAGAAGIAAVAGLWYFFRFPVEMGVYIAVPCMVPFLAMGFIKIQGLTPWGYLKEIVYTYRTRILIYDADELPEHSWPIRDRDVSWRKKARRKKHREAGCFEK